jgi:predicted Zn-dependent protease
MTELEGYYFDGQRPIAVGAKLEIGHHRTTLSRGATEGNFQTADLKVSPRAGGSQRFINLPDGGQFICSDQGSLDTLPQESPSEGPVAWLEARWQVALAGVGITLMLVLAGYFFGLPVAAEKIAARIPLETEAALGAEALDWLDEQGWFQETTLSDYAKTQVQERFNHLISDLPIKANCRLEFRSGKRFGPNAFALPGGTIVITDEMVRLNGGWDEVTAVLAHEIGHVELRHTLRSILQNSIIGVAVATVMADAATLSAVISGFPMLVAQTKYSRKFETEADTYAFELLKRCGYSPEAFARLMERLEAEYGHRRHPMAWISNHPVTSERIEAARQAAE